MTPLKRVLAIMTLELRLASRNRWVLLATAALALFALTLAFLGSGTAGATSADALSVTAASLATLSVYLIPLIALLLSYDTIAGEVERGTLALTLATPVSRTELLAGKFIAHIIILSAAIVIGFGIAGLAIIAVHGMVLAGVLAWLRIIATGILLGAVFAAIGCAVSASVSRTGTAAALAILAWLVIVILYDLALLGALIADAGGTFTKSIFPLLALANPGDAFRLFNLAALEAAMPSAGIDGLARTMPYPPSAALAAMALWLAVALAASLYGIKKVKP